MIDKFMKSVQADKTASKRIGVAEGKFVVPDDFDDYNDEIADKKIDRKGDLNSLWEFIEI